LRRTEAGKEENLETLEKKKSSLRTGAELEERTLRFAVQIVAFVGSLPRSDAGVVIGRQLLRSGTSIGANYREANRGESPDDFAHKVAIAVKEAAETEYWLQLCGRTNLAQASALSVLTIEINELIAILSTILRRARAPRC
jgi:four helix bundle protein